MGFVGRTGELACLATALDGAAAGRGGTVLVAGEAGIGKTRLTREFAERAGGRDAVVLTGRCIDLVGTGMPYLAFAEAFRSHREALPQLRLPEPKRPDDAPQLPLFEKVLAALDELATAGPVALVLEDLHWADTSTLGLIAFLTHNVSGHNVVIVGTYRSEEVHQDEPLPRMVSEFRRARAASFVELQPLPADELGAMLGAMSGQPPAADLLETIVTRSGGNPFFAEELFAAAARGEQTLPALLRDVLLQRVGRLDPASLEVLKVASAVGRDVPYRLLAAVVARSRPELLDALRCAVDGGVLVPDQPAGTFRFRHALLAEAVYGTLIPGEREELHGRLARALRDDPGLVGDQAAAGELAQHWAAAGCAPEALAASVQAAADAEAVSGLAVALRQLERAVGLWPRVPDADRPAGMDLAAVLARAAELADLTGSSPRAVELVRDAIHLLDGGAEPVRLALLHERLGSYLLSGGDREAGLAACQRAAELVPAAPPSAERARVLTTLANALMLSWRHAESAVVCAEALRTAEAIGDDRPALRALAIRGVDRCYLGRPGDGLADLRDALSRALQRGGPRDVPHCYSNLCEALVVTGQLPEVVKTAFDGRDHARRLGFARSFGDLLAAYAAEGLLETGDWEQAEAVLGEVLRTGATFWTHFPQLLAAQLAIGRGNLEAARHHLEVAERGARRSCSAARYLHLVAEVACWERRPDAALDAVDEGLLDAVAGAAAHQRVRFSAVGLRAVAELAELAAVRRDTVAVAAARRDADRLLAEAGRAAEQARPVTPAAAAWHAMATAEYRRATGRPQPEPWQAVATRWQDLDRPYLAAYCWWRCAEARVSAGSPAATTAAARAAYRVARRLGALPLRRELELLAQRARLDLVGLDGGARPEVATLLGLTGREAEVLRLLSRGYTNREVGAELTISVKTASVHVSNILRKLGVANRMDAAAIAHRLLPRTSRETVVSGRPR